MNHISLATSKQLKSWGCRMDTDNGYYENEQGEYYLSKNPHFWKTKPHFAVYDLRDIICTEMAKAFFMPYNTEGQTDTITHVILAYLQQNEQEEAEQYLLDNCVFNPKNKEDLLGEMCGAKESIDLLNNL